MAHANLLVIDDDESMQTLLRLQFKAVGYNVISVENSEDALSMIEEHHPDVVILDVMMPGIDGLELCRRIRALPGNLGNTWIIVLSAAPTEANMVRALTDGADVFIAKPHNSAVLEAYIYAALRRLGQYHGSVVNEICIHNLRIDIIRNRVYIDERETPLTTLQYKVLEYLARNAHTGNWITQKMLITHVWGDDTVFDEQRVRRCISDLREAIGDKQREEKLILTKIGSGYRLREPS